MQPFLMELATQVVLPVAVMAFSTAGTILVPALVYKLVSWLNIKEDVKRKELEEKWVATLHAAGANGLKVAMARLGMGTTAITGKVSAEALSMAVNYVKSKNPETVAKLGVSEKDITDVILSKVPDLLARLK